MTKPKNRHRGTTLATFLNKEGLLEESSAIAVKRVIAWQLEEAMKEETEKND